MTFFFQTSLGRSMESLQVIKERYFITILAVLRKKIYVKIDNFLKFFAYQGHRFFEKWLTSLLRDTGHKFVIDCTNGVANEC